MKKLLCLCFVLSATGASAVLITSFEDIDTYLQRGQEMIVARCQKAHTFGEYIANKHVVVDGLLPAEVDVTRTLKGTIGPGPLTITTIYPMRAGKDYLLYTLGGDHFYATAELAVVEVPPKFE